MAVLATDRVTRRVYGVKVGDVWIYVGSSHLPLSLLEHNHRHWREKRYSDTNFRKNLTDNPEYASAVFHTLLEFEKITLKQIESIEGQLIRSLTPTLNLDTDPVASSIKYGRYS